MHPHCDSGQAGPKVRSGVKEENPAFIKAGDAAIIMVTPSKPMVIETGEGDPAAGKVRHSRHGHDRRGRHVHERGTTR